jgi:hypothetical protein
VLWFRVIGDVYTTLYLFPGYNVSQHFKFPRKYQASEPPETNREAEASSLDKSQSIRPWKRHSAMKCVYQMHVSVRAKGAKRRVGSLEHTAGNASHALDGYIIHRKEFRHMAPCLAQQPRLLGLP